MPLTHTSYLLDLLAPRVFRQGIPSRARAGTRSGSSAAAAAPRHDEETAGYGGAGRRGDVDHAPEERNIAGPSRLPEQSIYEAPRSALRTTSSSASRFHRPDARRSWIPSFEEPVSSSTTPKLTQNSRPPHRPSSTPSLPVKSRPLYPQSPKHPSKLQHHKPPPHTRQAPPPFSSQFVHPNPPPASALFPLLQPHLTKATGDLLIRYSQRVDDQRTELATRDLMGRMRVAPVSWIADATPRQRNPFDTARVAVGRLAQSEQGFGSGDDPPDAAGEPLLEVPPRKPISAEIRELRAKTNAWARWMWPPLPPAVASSTLDPHIFLCRHHHLLLNPPRGIRPTFIDAVRRLEALPGVKGHDLLSLLHLHLAYPSHAPPAPSITPSPSPDPNPLLTPVFQLMLHAPHLRPTRQTLHLLILSTLFAPLSTSSSSTPVSLRGRRAELHSLLTLFRTQWRITPGCEGWRHIARYAVHCDDKAWAREAWEGWWNVRAFYEHEAYFAAGVVDTQDNGAVGDEEDVVFRFRHRGREFFRWMKVVKTMEEKGWIRQRGIWGEGGGAGAEKGWGKEGWEWLSGDANVGEESSISSHTSQD